MDTVHAPISPQELIAKEDRWSAHISHPLDVVIERASGIWVWDVAGKRYMDCLSAYSAVNQGHCHPRILETLRAQAGRATLTSRAFRNEELPLFCEELARLCRMEMVLPMNTGAEAVETAVKMARRWGYRVRQIPENCAEIIVCRNNFHGRTTTVISFSTEPAYRAGFGPLTPGFAAVEFGDAAALERAVGPNTCAFLFEPIQCESGIHIPPEGYLRAVREICSRRNILMIADEIQTALGRTGPMFACWREDVQPDAFVLGKALSGGFYPVSAVVSRAEIMDVFEPGSHGSTYGGNPLAAAVARTALAVIQDENLCERSAALGEWFLGELKKIRHPEIREIRGCGLLIGIELKVPARPYCERLARAGLLCKETHGTVVRLAPPLVISQDEAAWAAARIQQVFAA